MTESDGDRSDGALAVPVLLTGRPVVAFPQPDALDTLDAALKPEVRRLAEHMRALFAPLGLSVRRYATLHHYDPGTVSRYLSGQRLPSAKFLDELLAAIAGLPHGGTVTPEVREHTHALFLEALRVSNSAGYHLQVAMDRAHLAEIAAQQAETTVQALQEALATREQRIHDLEMQNRELTAAWSADRSETEAALELHEQRHRQTADERQVLLAQIERLKDELRRAMTARDKAVSRATAMERALAAVEADPTAAVRDDPSVPSPAEQTEQREHREQQAQPEQPDTADYPNGRRQRATETLDDTERTAEGITDDRLKALALAEIAKAAVDFDPDRAFRLAGQAEGIAQGIADGRLRTLAMAEIASVLADTHPDRSARMSRDAELATDPDLAERTAGNIADDRLKALALAEIARAVAGTDSDRAFRLAGWAEGIAQGIADGHLRALALAEIARVLAGTHPDRAARLSRDAELATEGIADQDWKAVARAEVAKVLAHSGVEERRNRGRAAGTASELFPVADGSEPDADTVHVRRPVFGVAGPSSDSPRRAEASPATERSRHPGWWW